MIFIILRVTFYIQCMRCVIPCLARTDEVLANLREQSIILRRPAREGLRAPCMQVD
jgi:hypothetical protein